MAEIYQQIKWQLKKDKLEQLLKEADGNYSALQFEMNIETGAVTNYYISLVGGDAARATEAAAAPGTKIPVCPVPPDCN